MPLGEKQIGQVVRDVLAIGAKRAKGAELAVAVSSGRAANTRFALGEITSTGDVDETTVSVTVQYGLRRATAETNQTDAASLGALVERTARMAERAPEDPEAMPALGKQRYLPMPRAYDPGTAALAASVRADAARAAIAAAEEAKVVAAGFYRHWGGTRSIGTSAGLVASHSSTNAELTCTARTSDGTGSGWGAGVGERAADLDPAAIARSAVDTAVRSKSPRKLEPGRYTVVLAPEAVTGLVQLLAGALNARRADEGRSFFSKPGGGTLVGSKIFGDAITLRSDPTDPATPGATFDQEGVPLAPTSWIDKGTLTGLIYDRYWAKKQGKQPTGFQNRWTLAGGSATREELVKGVKRGVLISRFWYIRMVDPQTILLTGLTRDGTFLIEDGEIVAPVNNFRFNESPAAMLANVEAMTKDTARTAIAWRVPAIRAAQFNLASISEAV